jgi:hypothetical protein
MKSDPIINKFYEIIQIKPLIRVFLAEIRFVIEGKFQKNHNEDQMNLLLSNPEILNP